MSNSPVHTDRIKGLFSLNVRYFKMSGLQYLVGKNVQIKIILSFKDPIINKI